MCKPLPTFRTSCHGPDVYSLIGTEGSTGTKILALTGKVNNSGLVEVPMGVTLRQVCIRHRVRYSKGQEVQGCSDRWPLRRMHT